MIMYFYAKRACLNSARMDFLHWAAVSSVFSYGRSTPVPLPAPLHAPLMKDNRMGGPPPQKVGRNVVVGNSGDYMIKNFKSAKENELRFPNRYVVDDWPDGDQSRVEINPAKIEDLGFFAEDTILLRGRFKRETRVLVLANEAVDPTRIRMCAQVRKNCNANVGDVVSLHALPDGVPFSSKVKVLPFDSDVAKLPKELDLFETYVRGFFKDRFRPVTIGDCYVLQPAAPAPGAAHEALPDVEFKIVATEPTPACVVADGGEIFCADEPLSRG